MRHQTALWTHIPCQKAARMSVCVILITSLCVAGIKAPIKPQHRFTHLIRSVCLLLSPSLLIDGLCIFSVVIRSLSSRGCCKYSLSECQPAGRTSWLGNAPKPTIILSEAPEGMGQRSMPHCNEIRSHQQKCVRVYARAGEVM